LVAAAADVAHSRAAAAAFDLTFAIGAQLAGCRRSPGVGRFATSALLNGSIQSPGRRVVFSLAELIRERKGSVMTISLPGLIVLIIIAAVCGAIGRAIAGGVRGGLLVSTALGFIGAIVGPWLAAQLKLAEPLMVNIGGHPFGILWSIIGAAIFVAFIHLISRR
jgi:uncharacterized membrane protein YeaQ/YmgE (transglycosylase-associated protein family)